MSSIKPICFKENLFYDNDENIEYIPTQLLKWRFWVYC